MDALDFLKDNEHLVERFFACDDDIKLDWLKRKKMKMKITNQNFIISSRKGKSVSQVQKIDTVKYIRAVR